MDPTASLSTIAEAAGIGRTTLHKRYPTRHDLLFAVAKDSLEQLSAATEQSGISDPDVPIPDALRRMVELSVPLGSRVSFLLRQPSLDSEEELMLTLQEMDRPVEAFVRRAQDAGVLRPDVPAWWVISTLYSILYTTWEGVAMGRLAPLDAPRLALDTILNGLGGKNS
ncbi:TetR/AcrR family transcriptional regulator [Amycolatopsis suaedae]|nr:TetR/AcrR family transcriptional regulator [Amycolatopsis suaedae]